VKIERTFLMVKPDGIQRSKVGEVISRMEKRGYKIVALKMLSIDEDKASRHYAEHKGKSFFQGLCDFITSGPVVAMVIEGQGAIEGVRAMMGSTDPKRSAPGTIRGDMGIDLSRNIVHGSDSLESAKREISLFFEEGEIFEYTKAEDAWTYPHERKSGV